MLKHNVLRCQAESVRDDFEDFPITLYKNLKIFIEKVDKVF
jgi:hypothetical protein